MSEIGNWMNSVALKTKRLLRTWAVVVGLLCLLPPALHADDFFGTEKIRSFLKQRPTDREKYDQIKNSIEGVIGRISDSESVWVHLENKREFLRWTYKLSRSNLDVKRQEVRVWLKYVSPKRSVSRGKKYNDWFKKKVAFEMGKAFRNRRVRVEYDYLDKAYRLTGVAWAGDTSINVWLVQNGWSFYLLEEGESRFHEDFKNAEKRAESRQLGLWKPPKQ